MPVTILLSVELEPVRLMYVANRKANRPRLIDWTIRANTYSQKQFLINTKAVYLKGIRKKKKKKKKKKIIEASRNSDAKILTKGCLYINGICAMFLENLLFH